MTTKCEYLYLFLNVFDKVEITWLLFAFFLCFRGASSVVRLCTQRGTANEYAVKILKKNVGFQSDSFRMAVIIEIRLAKCYLFTEQFGRFTG